MPTIILINIRDEFTFLGTFHRYFFFFFQIRETRDSTRQYNQQINTQNFHILSLYILFGNLLHSHNKNNITILNTFTYFACCYVNSECSHELFVQYHICVVSFRFETLSQVFPHFSTKERETNNKRERERSFAVNVSLRLTVFLFSF